MTSKGRLVIGFAVSVLATTVAARAQNAMAPDPNLGPSTSIEESQIPGTSPGSPQLAMALDPNQGLTITGEEARIPGTVAGSPQLAMAPDPNVATSTTDVEATVQAMPAVDAVAASGSMETIAQ